MKELHYLCDTPLYKEAKVLVRKDWVTLFESNNILKVNNVIEFDNNINKDDVDNFEEVIEKAMTSFLVQIFLEVEQIFDQEYESPIYVAPNEEYQPLGLF
jgi:hypothetical protein